jgi:hypothetical protein
VKKLNKHATRTFSKLVEQLAIGEGRCIDNSSPSFMPVYVQRCSEHLYSIAHRSHRDPAQLPDPLVEFYVVDDPAFEGQQAAYPATVDHFHAAYQRTVEFDEAGVPVRFARAAQADLASFCDMWMRNIAWQQGLNEQHPAQPSE